MRIVTALAVLVALGCGGPEPSGPAPDWTRADPGALDASDAARLETARRAAKDLFVTLTSRLGDAVAEGGFPAAIGVCRDAAPEIAREVGEEHGVRIGRTSHRLRNPANAPPAWAADLLADGGPDPALAEPNVFFAPDGRMGVTLPIVLKEMCTKCHGGEEEIPAETAAEIDRLYPDDRARGFAPGDLRGIFWIELP